MVVAATLVVAAVVLFGGGWLIGRLGIGRIADPSSTTDLEREFIERMRNVSLVGAHTEMGHANGESQPERYDISSVEKVDDDRWRFNAVLQCCGINGAFPVVLPMRWTGDTPMIMMTDTSLPGLGTFSVRILLYRERYSGTWQHGDREGFMSGRIEKRRAAEQWAPASQPANV